MYATGLPLEHHVVSVGAAPVPQSARKASTIADAAGAVGHDSS